MMAGARRFTGPRSSTDEAEFRRRMDEAKDKTLLSKVVERHTKLRKRGGRELVGLCPFHQEKSPSFEVNDAKGVFHCHGCGASGDHFTILTRLDRLSFRNAYEALSGNTFPSVSDEERAQARAEDARLRSLAIEDARLMWDQCRPEGMGERYLRETRGITMPVPAAVRFGVVPTSRDDAGNWKRPYPAVVLACTDERGAIVGLQRIFLSDDGREKRWGKRSKFSLGRPRGAAVHLNHINHPPDDPSEVIITEGPEDGLSLAQELPGQQVWVALGTAMMPEITFPDAISSIVIAAQNDRAGRTAADAAGDALLERGLAVRIMYPQSDFKDWNDQLRGVRG